MRLERELQRLPGFPLGEVVALGAALSLATSLLGKAR